MKPPVRVGVIGLGMAGSHHVRDFAGCPDAAVVGGADPGGPALRRARALQPDAAFVEDYHDLLARDDVDLVVVATPHDLHFGMVVDALRAGKHVLCEKPLAITVAECDGMIAAAAEAGRELFVVQTQRGSPPFRRLKRVLDENDFGPLVGGAAMYLGCEVRRMGEVDNWKGTHARAGGGVLLDGGCHVIDLCNWYLGRPVGVMARSRTPAGWHAHKGETTGQLLISYESGAVVQVLASFEARLAGSFTDGTLGISVDLYAEQGSARAEYAYLGKYGARTSVRYVCRGDEEHVIQPQGGDGANFARNVVDCLLGRGEPLVTAREARQAVAVVQAAYESARTGRQVDVPA